VSGRRLLDLRLGGIYALERIARDSEADRATIAEVLTAYIRIHSPWPPRLPGKAAPASPATRPPSCPTCVPHAGRPGCPSRARPRRLRQSRHPV